MFLILRGLITDDGTLSFPILDKWMNGTPCERCVVNNVQVGSRNAAQSLF